MQIDLTPRGPGCGITVHYGISGLTDYTVPEEIANDADRFWAFVVDKNTPFNFVTLTGGTQNIGDMENFNIERLNWAQNAPPVITEGDSVTVNMSEDGSPTAFSLMLHATDPEEDTLTWSIDWDPSYGVASVSGTGASKTIEYTPASNYSGTDSFLVRVYDGYGGADRIRVNVNIAPVNDPPVVTNNGTQTVQFSDGPTDTTIVVTYNESGSLELSGLPDGITATPNCVVGTCTWTLGGFVTAEAGSYPLTVSDGTEIVSAGTITVSREDATVSFDSDNEAAMLVSAPGGSLITNALSLTVYVQEKQPDLALAMAEAGDINLADLTVTLTPLTGGSAITLACSATPVSGTGYNALKTFTCNNNVPLSVNTYDVVASVTGNYYTGTAYDSFTVYDPSLGFATGGGWFFWPGSDDSATGYPGDKTNFGFTMKYGKKGTAPRGNLIVVRHYADGTVSRIKSNSLETLTLQDANGCGIATFMGRVTYMMWDDGLGTYLNTGGNPFSVYAKDCNDPGSGFDYFWVLSVGDFVMDKPASSEAIVLGGGNIAVPHKRTTR